jgi:hypothetical protein
MEPSNQSDQLWKALVEGGDASTKAIAHFISLSERQRDATFEQLLRRAEGFVAALITEERTGNVREFRESKARLIRVLDAIPSLATTETLREVAQKRVAEIDKQTEPLTNIDIAMKCDELAKKLAPPSLNKLSTPTVVECESMEELKEKLSEVLPAEIAKDIIAQIEASGGDIILGSISLTKMKKKKSPPSE